MQYAAAQHAIRNVHRFKPALQANVAELLSERIAQFYLKLNI